MNRRVPLPAPRRLLLGAALTLCASAPSPVSAQGAPACPSGLISNVFIDNHSVFDLSDAGQSERFGWAYQLANRLHVRTREEVIRREILFAEGECYDVERLRDSERLLRALDFIADVDIFGVQQPDGTLHVIVDTQDEWSTRIEPRLGSGGALGLRGLRLREDNLLGTGQHLSAFYINDEEKQVYGLAYRAPQLFRSRWDGELEVGKTPVGVLVSQAITYPFVGQVGRWAFRQAVRHDDHYFEYWMPDGPELTAVWLPERRQTVEVGGVYRWGGHRYNRTLLGAALTAERISFPGPSLFADPDRRDRSPPPLLRSMVDSLESVRLMLLTGQRNVYYVRRRALDTVNGTEDVRLGVETEIAVGPSLPGLGEPRDVALNLALFAGGELFGRALGGAQLVVEARRSYDAPPQQSEWSDVFAQLNALTYWRSSPQSRHTLVAAVSGVGGWHDRVPFQLTVGADAGLRGYPRHLYPGGRRVVATLEQRSYLGWPLPELFDLGAVAFVDVGKMWAGEVPYGQESPLLANVGVGLRGAFPPGSRQTFRVDVGVPLQAGLGLRDVVVSIGVGQRIGSRTAARDAQLRRSLGQGISSTFIFASQP